MNNIKYYPKAKRLTSNSAKEAFDSEQTSSELEMSYR